MNPSNIGDLDVDHFSSPKRTERHLKMVKQKFLERQTKCNKMKKHIYRLVHKIAKYKDLVKSLEEKQLLAENAAHQLQVHTYFT